MTTATMPKPAVLKKALKPVVEKLLVLTAYAQVERERVDAIQREVLAAGEYFGKDRDGETYRITEPSKAWHIEDEAAAAEYYGKLNAIHLAAGFEQAADGYCPALIAETEQMHAENALIEVASQFFPDITNDRLLNGTAEKDGLQTRREWIDLCIGLTLCKK